MSGALPWTRALAERINAVETKASESVKAKSPPDFRFVEKLRPHLVTLVGGVGFHALVLRARAMAVAEISWLREIRIREDGAFEGLEGLKPRVKAKEIFEARIVLLEQLLGLLQAFIGEILTV